MCATASVPIAAALVKGFLRRSVGVSDGGLDNMAGGAIYRSFGRTVLGIYLATIIRYGSGWPLIGY